MKPRFRQLRPGETDHEFLWLVVSLATFLLAWLWLHFRLPWPDCVFAECTGLPCPTCGGTRALRSIFAGDWGNAWRWNPLVTAGFWSVAAYDLYAAVVLAGRLPRLRLGPFPEKLVHILRGAAWLLLLANWLYVGLTVPVGHHKTRADLDGRRAMRPDVIRAQSG